MFGSSFKHSRVHCLFILNVIRAKTWAENCGIKCNEVHQLKAKY